MLIYSRLEKNSSTFVAIILNKYIWIFLLEASIQYWGSRFKRVFRGLRSSWFKIISDKFTGRSKGFGFVEMPNDDEAQKQLTNWTELLFKDAIVVNKSEPKPEGERRSFNNNRGGFSCGYGETAGGDNRGGETEEDINIFSSYKKGVNENWHLFVSL
jgi:RNA recognition motif-containing protein